MRGGVRVTNSSGILVANMSAGNNMVFEPQSAGEAAPTHASGCLLEKGGKFILAEKTTHIVLEVQGKDLAKQVGNQVEVTGKAAVTGATQVVQVSELKPVAKGGCSAIAKKLGAATVAAGTGAAGAAAGTAGAAGTGAAAGGAAAGTAAGVGAAGAATAAGIGATTVAVVGGVAAAATVGGLAAVGSLPGQNGSSSASR